MCPNYSEGTLGIGADMPVGGLVTHSLPEGNHCHIPGGN